jgi:hypothetical protein
VIGALSTTKLTAHLQGAAAVRFRYLLLEQPLCDKRERPADHRDPHKREEDSEDPLVPSLRWFRR